MGVCRVCRFDHPVLERCEVAARKRMANVANTVVHGPEVVVHEDVPVVHRKDRHRNSEERKKYRREWMRRRRAGLGIACG